MSWFHVQFLQAISACGMQKLPATIAHETTALLTVGDIGAGRTALARVCRWTMTIVIVSDTKHRI